MVSDQLPYIKIAKKGFTIEDLLNISERKIGMGKVGGKAAGMLLAMKEGIGLESLTRPLKYADIVRRVHAGKEAT